jgi:lysozyme
MVFTEEQCRDLDTKDLSKAFAAEDLYLDRPEELPVNVRAAGALFTLNVGPDGLRVSSFRRLLNERRITDACNSLMLWVKARVGGGPMRVVNGLINRRTVERKLCLGELQ